MLSMTIALLLAILTVAGISPSAGAATPGITSSLLKNGQPVAPGTVLNEGDKLELRVQYDRSVGAGTSVEFEFDPNVVVSKPSGNEAIESITQTGNKVVITFKDPWPATVNQGVFDIDLTVDSVEHSSKEPITWKVDGDQSSVPVVIVNNGDQPANVTSERYAKKLNGSDRPSGNPLVWPNNRVTVTNGVVAVSPAILDDTLTYRLEVDTPNAGPARTNWEIADTLPSGLAYVPGSFAAKLTSWDDDLLNRTVQDPFPFTPTLTGDSFSTRVDLPAPSLLSVEYRVRVPDEAARLALQTALQAKYDALVAGAGHGNFQIELNNTAKFGGSIERTAHLRLRGTVADPNPGPDLNAAFAKSASWSSRNVETDADGDLTPPEDLTYTLRADLTKWDNDGANPNRVLGQNVVIRDELPTQASWKTGDPSFISTVGRGSGGAGGLALNNAGTCPGTSAADFRGDAFIGTYCVSGQVLLINVGKDDSTNVDIRAKVLVNSVTGLTKAGSTTIAGATAYRLRNTATFDYTTGSPASRQVDVTVVELPDGTDGYNDETVFAKSGVASSTEVDPGESTTVRYTFRLAGGKGIDAAKSHIIDAVDPDLFVLPGTLSDVIVPGDGSGGSKYDGQNLDSSHFVVTKVGSDLKIELSDAGKALAQARGTDKEWRVVIDLSTRPIGAAGPPPVKETLEIRNRAVLYGEDEKEHYWSEHTTESTSYGDEAEVRKRVFDPWDEEWVPTLKAYVDADGTLVRDLYTYRVEFLPHGNFNGVVISPVVDKLPAGVSFVGFVDEADAATGAGAATGPRDIGGNLEAVYAAAERTVTLRQKTGTVLDASQPIAAYLVVRVNDPSDVTEPIVNIIDDSHATIEPGDPPSIDIEKWTVEPTSSGPLYDAAGALVNDGFYGDFDAAGPGKELTIDEAQQIRFTISNDGGEPLTDIEVSDELVSGAGVVQDLACVFPGGATPGTQWSGPFQPGAKFECTGTLTLDDFAQSHVDRASVTGIGVHSREKVTDDDPWRAHTRPKAVSVGDFVWLDENRDGRQTTGEPGIPGVLLELVGPDGQPVTDIDDKPVLPVRTGPDGEYVFERLPALTGTETYTVRIVADEPQTRDVLEPYVPAPAGRGDRAGDSSTGEVSTLPGELQDDGAHDPTLDFGFMLKSYAVGDVVWIDRDRDGIQDADEAPLAGVRVELTDADGEPVRDVHGDVVEATTTDAQGRYLFDELGEGDYRVRFTLTPDQAARYQFTATDAGDDPKDSDAHVQADPAAGLTASFRLDDTNAALSGSYADQDFEATQGVDPTWDAGVVLKRVSVGDLVWLDEDRDGRQDAGEPGIPGVVLVLVGPDGQPVTDVFGQPVGPRTTDAEGRYSFDDLPALTGSDTYRVRIDRTASAKALAPYTPAPAKVGDREGDSDLWEATSLTGGLREDGDRDPTLDFGFMLKSYAIGDLVWIDKNDDGRQGVGEKPLAGVQVELLDVRTGGVVATTLTDAAGRYLFDNLPAGTYQVRFTLTKQQAKRYEFTRRNAGSDDARDSDAHRVRGTTGPIVLDDSNTALVRSYDRTVGASEGIDPTWDAGVVLTGDVGGESAGGGKGRGGDVAGVSSSGGLPGTGSPVGIGLIIGALALILGGVAVLVTGRRRGALH
ncbi:carboxypeptidase regulatory-like domain-containing protein [Nocardioides carbamazepini]|nr:carboxypeptidase regulatory-like domain-containing protein [Nocardioides carbamazepini]